MTVARGGAEFFFEALADATRQVVSQISGRDFEVDVSSSISTDTALEVPFIAEGSLVGGFGLRFTGASATHAASLLLGVASESAPLTDEQQEAVAELARQICGTFASALRARFSPLELRNETPFSPDLAKLNSEKELTVAADGSTFSFQVALTPELHQSLEEGKRVPSESRMHDVPTEPASAQIQPTQVMSPAQAGESQSDLRGNNLGVLLDLELPVTLRFGSREMLLKEVMELTSGSVVELDRRVREPVDLLIKNKLIARGEVVLVDGNFGLRVLEVASDHDRVACMP